MTNQTVVPYNELRPIHITVLVVADDDGTEIRIPDAQELEEARIVIDKLKSSAQLLLSLEDADQQQIGHKMLKIIESDEAALEVKRELYADLGDIATPRTYALTPPTKEFYDSARRKVEAMLGSDGDIESSLATEILPVALGVEADKVVFNETTMFLWKRFHDTLFPTETQRALAVARIKKRLASNS